ncbi:MAG: response regulator [Steroidobacteraceae bacterium]
MIGEVSDIGDRRRDLEERIRVSEERLRLGEAAGGIATFELNLHDGTWGWSPRAAVLFGLADTPAPPSMEDWKNSVFADDLPKIQVAADQAQLSGTFYVEIRIRTGDGSLRWIAGKGHVEESHAHPAFIRGAFYDITERKALEARLLAVNETLEARVSAARAEARMLEVLNDTGIALAAEHDLDRLVQIVTDAGVELSHAKFGALFYNVTDAQGEAYTLYTLSGTPREAFARFPMPRNTAIFEPTFRGGAPFRSPDILKDPRYGKTAPYHGMPEGHLPVRSYLAVPVVSRTGVVIGGLFFGHPQPDVFTERAERIVTALAAQAAVAIDNANLHEANRREIGARFKAEQELQQLNLTLETRAEERAQRLAASLVELEHTEQKFRLLVECVTDYAIYMLDTTGIVVNWNKGAERIKGYSREEIIGRDFSVFYTDADKVKNVPRMALARAAETGKYETEGWRLRKDGSRFWAGITINAVRDAADRLIGFVKITRDLTEKRAAAEHAQQMQKMEIVGRLTGGVAHDFNNLLTIIVGNLDTAQRTLVAPQADVDRIRSSVDQAMRGARRAESLTHRLLAFSRQQPLEPKPLDVGRLVAGMSDLLRRTLGEQITVETVLSGGVGQAHADANQLEMAILNLAVNARDAMPQGGKLTLETANVFLDQEYAATQTEVVAGHYVMLAVTDNGTGMTAEVKAKAFDPFFTTKDVGHGTGLGLSQVYGFVKQSLGHVKIYSELQQGTTIKLYLPRAESSAGLVEQVVESAPTPAARNETILVVEDDEDVRHYSAETLRELGYTVLEAENARFGLALIDAHPQIQLLFTDIGLPGGMNGRQLAEEASKRRPHIKMLFTTGYARDAIIHDGRLDPGVELIAKPFTQAALAAKLRSILDARRMTARVLLVEDEPLIQEVATAYLEEAGFAVDIAGTATEAMGQLSLLREGVDAVVVDIGLPDRTGDKLAREIRALYPDLPIVFTTGYVTPRATQDFTADSKVVFVTKPYLAADLTGALERLGIVIKRDGGT